MLARQIGDQLASGMQNSVVCSEDRTAVRRLVDRAQTDNASHGLIKARDQLDALAEICKTLAARSRSMRTYIARSGERHTDPAAYPAKPIPSPRRADAERAATGLCTRHRNLVLLEGEGHGQVSYGLRAAT